MLKPFDWNRPLIHNLMKAIPPLVSLVDDDVSEVRANALKVVSVLAI